MYIKDIGIKIATDREKVREIEIGHGKPERVRRKYKKFGILKFAHNSLKLLLYIISKVVIIF